MAHDGVVYDLDGTLVRLVVDWQSVADQIEAMLADAGVDYEGLRTWELLDAAQDAGIGEDVDALISRHERDGAHKAERLPLLDELRTSEKPVAVCSLNCEAACRIALEKFDLLDRVVAVVGRDTVATRKPHPEPLLEAVRALDVPPERALFVGDAERDAETAKRAGTCFRYVADSDA